MSANRWDNAQRLFQLALDLPNHARADLLERECKGDSALRREVESLLAASSKAGGFLSEPALPAAARGVAAAAETHRAGDRIGPYRLDGIVGSGGMGEVWRAHDARLDRDVAIKFGHAHFSERFSREAQAIAALNHPNICQLYDVGPNYLVMELVEGESPAGPLPTATVLNYARQIASALEAAHEKGIVHRDLKPGNIRVRSDGTVKLLDFGIAKLNEPPGDRSVTAEGMVLGTPAWMSPEQARGQQVDKRADIWAFGLLLFQWLTGSHPFDRPSAHETTAAVLTTEPNWSALPPELRRLIRKCLEKDPQRRLRDIGDVWELQDRQTEPPKGPGWLGAAMAVLLAAAIGLGSWRALNPARTPDQRLMRLDLDLGPELPLDAAGIANLVLSPDGASLAFVSRGRLFIRALQDGTVRQVGGEHGVNTPFFSPDGQWLAFFAQGKLRKIAVSGGAAFDICPTGAYFSGGAWGPDGNIIASLTPSGPLQIVPASGGAPQPVTALDRSSGEVTHRLPHFLPGGKAILFTSNNAVTDFENANIDVLSLADRRRKRLIRGGTFGRYVPSGHILYVNRGVLYAVPFDLDRLELRGEPVKVADDVAYSLYGSAQFDAASTGTLVYRTGGSSLTNVSLNQFDDHGGERDLLPKPGTYLNPRVSPDGQRILLMGRSASDMRLFVFDIQKEALLPLAQTESATGVPGSPFAIWTPDGKFIVFRSGGEMGDWGMYWIRVNGSGPPQRLTASKLSQTPAAFSPDGRTLAFYQGVSLMGWSDIWTLNIANDGTALRAGEAKPFVETKADETQPSFSRDGRWIAYASAGQSGPEIRVKPWPDDGRSWQVSSQGGTQPLFSRSRDELYFLNADRQLTVVPYRAAGGAFITERARPWSPLRIADLGASYWSYDLLPHQSGIVALTVPETARQRERGRLAVLLNLFEELRRSAPVK